MERLSTIGNSKAMEPMAIAKPSSIPFSPPKDEEKMAITEDKVDLKIELKSQEILERIETKFDSHADKIEKKFDKLESKLDQAIEKTDKVNEKLDSKNTKLLWWLIGILVVVSGGSIAINVSFLRSKQESPIPTHNSSSFSP